MIARSVLNFEGKQVSYACELGDGDGLEEKIGEIEVVCVHIDEVCWSVYVWFWWRICRMEERSKQNPQICNMTSLGVPGLGLMMLIQNLKLPGKEECKSLWLNVVVTEDLSLDSKNSPPFEIR
ncbi:hypothetical protein HanIR_Chr00c11g0907941 [Helianthus annuus]|nr:hypothetical protein HanIR_Chr00c11g0907941 [Helianthus annuus]